MCIAQLGRGQLNKRGFTLVELMVVVAIIAILAAIILPVQYRARFVGYQAACVSNLKSLGQAISVYQNDHGYRLPPSYMAGRIEERNWWWNAIQPYALTPKLNHCRAMPIWVTAGAGENSHQDRFGDYGMNIWAGGLDGASVRRPDVLFLLGDSATYLITYSWTDVAAKVVSDPLLGWVDPGRYIPPFCIRGYHPPVIDDAVIPFYMMGRANVLYLDGHVESQKALDCSVNGGTGYTAPDGRPIWEIMDPDAKPSWMNWMQ